jgi:hypothetical protein
VLGRVEGLDLDRAAVDRDAPRRGIGWAHPARVGSAYPRRRFGPRAPVTYDPPDE